MRGIPTKIWLPLVILAGGVGVALLVAATGPESKRRPSQRPARLVEVTILESGPARVIVEAMGTVRPAQEVEMRAQVSGEVVHMSEAFLPGGFLRKGDAILRIEPRDYELAVRRQQSEVARVRQSLKLEEGQQSVARREFELLGEVLDEGDSELVLRQPQLDAAQKALDAAQASLEQARLDLGRTRIVAPFNAVVEEKQVDLGAVLSANTGLAALVGTDRCWVEVLVPVEDLAWIEFPGDGGSGGSTVRIRQDAVWGDGVSREGRVLGRLGSLESAGRMARFLVEVEDPFSLRRENRAAPPLLMNSFVTVEVQGRKLDDVVAVDRRYVHNGDTVWLVDGKGTLRIVTLDPLYAGAGRILVGEELRAGAKLVTSEISTPVEGMSLRVRGQEPAADGDGQPKKKRGAKGQ